MEKMDMAVDNQFIKHLSPKLTGCGFLQNGFLFLHAYCFIYLFLLSYYLTSVSVMFFPVIIIFFNSNLFLHNGREIKTIFDLTFRYNDNKGYLYFDL